jgi:Spy/CpxP family protein refolding chaperone
MMEELDSNANLTVSLHRTHRWRMAIAGLVILVAGITLGIAGTLLVIKPSERRPPLMPWMAAERTLHRMQDELNLTPEQVDQIEAILREHFETLEALREAARPKISEVFEAMKTGIDAVLTEQQRSDWEKATARFEEEFHRGMRRRGGPRGPGGPGGPGEGFRDRRSRFPGPGPDGGPGPDDDRGPREWRRGRSRSGEGPGLRGGRRDANDVPTPAEPNPGQVPPQRQDEPNSP